MVASGYQTERIIWELVFSFLLAFSIIEIYLSRSLWKDNKKTESKALQKALMPCCLLTGLIGVIIGVDIRGAFQIYTTIPDYVRFWLMIMGVVPGLAFAHVWLLQIYASVCKANGYSGFLGTGINVKRRSILLGFFICSWIILVPVATSCMLYFNRLVYANILWIWGVFNTSLTLYYSINCHALMNESIENLTGGSKSTNKPGDKNHMLYERKLIVQKLRLGILCSSGIWCFCFGSTIYHFTVARKYDIVPILHADPENYSASVVVILSSLSMAIICIGALCLLGNLFGCRPDDSEPSKDPSKVIKTTGNETTQNL
jgi:hypothetical protein